MLGENGLRKFASLLVSVFVFIFCYLSNSGASDKDYGAAIFTDATGRLVTTIPNSDKVDFFIQQKISQMSSTGVKLDSAPEGTGPLFTNSDSMVRTNDDGKIQVYIHVHTLGPDVKALLESYGATIEIVNEDLEIVQAWIPPSQVYEIAQLSFTKRIRMPSYAITEKGKATATKPTSMHPAAIIQKGRVTTEGDAILRANELRALGFDGAGAKVGVISDGVINKATAVASGDLPSNITVLRAGSGDEGTAMLEIVHDLAPGAELGFCGPETDLEFIDCVEKLGGVFGANIIVDDLNYKDAPYFEDGPIAQAVKNILPNRVYASSAGNQGNNRHYTASFTGTNSLGLTKGGVPVTEHNFGLASGGAADPTLNVLLYPGDTDIWLQWNDPFDKSINDYDLYLLNSSNGIIISSTITQNGNGDPIEAIGVRNSGTSPARAYIAVTKVAGAADKQLKLFLFSRTQSFMEQYAVSAGSMWGHKAVPGVLATGAIDAADPGHDTIRNFSSRGPVEIYFPARETRQKPDVTAIDGVSVTGAGGFPSPFSGTSAAAPHVAGVAALLIGKLGTADQVNQAIKNSAVDLGTPGVDNTFGYGRVDAVAAAKALNQPPDSQIDTPAGAITITKGESVNFSGSCTDPNSTANSKALWQFAAGSGIAAITLEDPGPVLFNASGTFSVTFACTDGFGVVDPTPATRVVTVNEPPVAGGGGGGSGGGGGCFINAISP